MLSNNLSTPRSNGSSLNTSKSVELPFMMSILRTLKEHFNTVNKEQYNNRAPIEDLFNLFQQLLNNYIQLYLPVKSKQNYIKATTIITNSLKDDIALFLDNNYSNNNYTAHNNKTNYSSHCNSSSIFLNISSESSFTLNNGCSTGIDKDKFNDSFLNCRELSNEDIIKKIKQKIEKKNLDMTIQYNTLPTYPNNTTSNNNNNNNQLIYNTQSIFTPVKNIKPRYYHTKQQPPNLNSANVHNQKTKNNTNKTTKPINISINTLETPIAKNNHNSSYIKERTLSMPNKKTKPISKLIQPNNKTQTNSNININNRNSMLIKPSTKEPTINTTSNVHSNTNTNANVSIDKKNMLNHSFNHPVHSHRQNSVPSQQNRHSNHLRTYSNTSSSLNRNLKEKKEEPLLTTTTLISQPNANKQVNQNDKMNISINDNSKLNATFVCTTVKTGNVVQKYTLNTKANQNIPKASRYANCLLSKYKGLIAAYNDGQVPGKK